MIKIDVQGAEKIRGRIGDDHDLHLSAASEHGGARAAPRDRATEDPASLQARLELAVSELALKDTYDHQVVNDDAARAAREILAIIEADRAARGGAS